MGKSGRNDFMYICQISNTSKFSLSLGALIVKCTTHDYLYMMKSTRGKHATIHKDKVKVNSIEILCDLICPFYT